MRTSCSRFMGHLACMCGPRGKIVNELETSAQPNHKTVRTERHGITAPGVSMRRRSLVLAKGATATRPPDAPENTFLVCDIFAQTTLGL